MFSPDPNIRVTTDDKTEDMKLSDVTRRYHLSVYDLVRVFISLALDKPLPMIKGHKLEIRK